MKQRTTIVLLILFFAGLIALWWADSAKIPDYRQRQRMAGRVLPELVDVRPEEVRRIEIAGGERRLVFTRQDDDSWQMIEPVDTLADRSRIAILLSNLKDLRKNADATTIEGPAAPYGLAPPARVVRLFGADSRTPLAGLELGGTIGTGRYVRSLGRGGIEVADAQKLSPLELAASAWRERALFGLSPYDVARLKIVGPDRALSLQRDEGRWQIRQPIRAPADAQKVEGLLADLAALRVVDGDAGFVADDVREMARYGLAPARLSIEATPTATPGKPGARPETVLIGAEVPGLVDRAYARRRDQDDVARIDVRPLRDLGAAPNELRSHKVADFDPDHVASVRVRVGEVHHDLTRGPGGWTSSGAWAGRADPQVVAELLTRLNALQTSDFLDPKSVDRPGLDPPFATLQVRLRGPTASAAPEGPPDVDLRIGRHDAGRKTLYAQLGGDPSVLALPDAFLEALPRDALAFRPRTLAAQDPRQIGRVTVRQGGRTAVVEAGPAGSWRMTAPVSTPADAEAVSRLAVLLARLRADRLVAAQPTDLTPYGLDAPGLVVSWEGRSGAGSGTSGTLAVGQDVPRGAGTRYAQLAGDPMVFTLRPEAIAILTAELRDRRVVSFPADQAARLEVRWPERVFAFARRARPSAADPSAWAPEPGSGPPGFEAARVDPLIAALANLRALRFAQDDGPLPPGSGLAPPVASFRVQLKGDLGTRALRLGQPAGPGQRWATTAAGPSGAVFVLPESGWEPYLPPTGPAPAVLPEDVFAPDAKSPR